MENHDKDKNYIPHKAYSRRVRNKHTLDAREEIRNTGYRDSIRIGSGRAPGGNPVSIQLSSSREPDTKHRGWRLHEVTTTCTVEIEEGIPLWGNNFYRVI